MIYIKILLCINLFFYINEQYMNHVMYADDICLLAPNAIGLQRMLDVCINLSIRNDIMFNPMKSICIDFLNLRAISYIVQLFA